MNEHKITIWYNIQKYDNGLMIVGHHKNVGYPVAYFEQNNFEPPRIVQRRAEIALKEFESGIRRPKRNYWEDEYNRNS